MPYIQEEVREALDSHIDRLADALDNEGECNYAISRLLCMSHKIDVAPKYSKINKIVGILECIKLEFYRRLSLYEQAKIEENGDVNEYCEFEKTMSSNSTGVLDDGVL